MNIENWLENFKTAWLNKDLPGVLELFDEKVSYYETPFLKLNTKEEILKEWQGILETENISLDYEVFIENNNKSAVNWSLSYDYKGSRHGLKGTYFIELNKEGLCTFFQQTFEKDN